MTGSRNLVTFVAGSLLLAAGAFGAGTSKGNLRLYDSVEVQGKQLPPGDYKVEWNGEGPNVALSITSGKKTVASVQAQVVSVTPKSPSDGYTAKKLDDGKNALTEIFFGGKSYELRLGDQSAATSSQSGANGANQ